MADIEDEARKTFGQASECHLSLDASELCAETVVNAATERQWMQARSRDIEPIRVGVHVRVPIRCTQHTQDAFPTADDSSSRHGDVLECCAGGQLHR